MHSDAPSPATAAKPAQACLRWAVPLPRGAGEDGIWTGSAGAVHIRQRVRSKEMSWPALPVASSSLSKILSTMVVTRRRPP